ncbi:unnamed protein product [Protopolystoma xenopodis]|uniref:Tryptophan synthase beta chain-like PALP domain-containing protein n=1 Tax=Protopolystoma xenopodis TaxID=117903 RepID=A0A3S5AGK0_9PLAT|nr:unnamed protein product [Protopolystoma xenopodis]
MAVSMVGTNSLYTCLDMIDKMVSVNEGYIAKAILALLETEKCVVEGAGAVTLAAIMEGKLPELQGKR